MGDRAVCISSLEAEYINTCVCVCVCVCVYIYIYVCMEEGRSIVEYWKESMDVFGN